MMNPLRYSILTHSSLIDVFRLDIPLQSTFMGVDISVLVVSGIILVALVLFVIEPVPVDVTAIGIMVSLILLGEWTKVTPADGVKSFSNPATLTVLAMMIISGGDTSCC